MPHNMDDFHSVQAKQYFLLLEKYSHIEDLTIYHRNAQFRYLVALHMSGTNLSFHICVAIGNK